MSKHIIAFNIKGGVGKSTVIERLGMELLRLEHSISIYNTDQQVHVSVQETNNADFYLYDTMGSFSAENLKLLKAAANVDATIIVPLGTGKNDFKDMDFLRQQLEKYAVLEKTIFVFTKVRKVSKQLLIRRKQLLDMDLKVAKWSMPILEDFAECRDTARTRNEISQFLHEVIL